MLQPLGHLAIKNNRTRVYFLTISALQVDVRNEHGRLFVDGTQLERFSNQQIKGTDIIGLGIPFNQDQVVHINMIETKSEEKSLLLARV